jgi:hypothetical protein
LATADGDLIDGQAAQAPECGAGEALLQMALLDIFDQIPAHVQVPGHSLDRYVTAGLQGVAFEGVGVAEAGVGKIQSPPGVPAGRPSNRPVGPPAGSTRACYRWAGSAAGVPEFPAGSPGGIGKPSSPDLAV